MLYPIITNPHVMEDLNKYLEKISRGGWNLFETYKVGEDINLALMQMGMNFDYPYFLEQYINGYPNSREPDEEDLEVISRTQDYVPLVAQPFTPGQIIFHGGTWPRNGAGEMRRAFITDRLLSTSFSAEVAINHVLNPRMNSEHPDVWVLTVRESPCQSRALMLQYQGEMKHELESIFETPTFISMTHQRRINKINYVFANLY